jgi:hypothetical protein
MKCQNKREQLSEQDPIIAKISLYVIPNNKCSVRTNQGKGQNMLLLSVEQDITIARTTFYYIQNNFVCHLDKKNKVL